MEFGPLANDLCSICHANFHIPCEAICSHCKLHHARVAACIRNKLLQMPSLSPTDHSLNPTEHSLSQHHDLEVAQILSKIHAYNRGFVANPPLFFQRVQDLPFLLHRLLREFLNPQRSLMCVAGVCCEREERK